MADAKDTKKDTAKTPSSKPKPARRKTAKPKATATKGRSGSAAKATSKTADAKAAEKSKPAAKASEKSKPAAKRPARSRARAGAKADAKSGSTAKRKAAPKQPPERPVVNARARYVRVAPRKARLIAEQVRGLPLEDAQTLLRFSTRSAAQDIAKLINSAAANAENNHDLVADDLLVADVRVDEGPTLRRYRPRALGRATRINKRTSHIHVALTPEE